MKPRVIAFYLPQFHPLPENDEWWGKGFTEWTNVGKAKPLFKGHDQPRVPTELGYYDLRMPEIREAQAEMAREAGIEGFMYWHYWFGNGRTLMADIFKEVLESGKPDYPFCLGWANHSWYSKQWNKDGTSSNKLLVEQRYPGEEDARMYFESLLPAFKDNRYIKIDSKPLFYIFDPLILPEEYILWFREWAKEAGLPDIFFVANIVKVYDKADEFLKKGYDAVTYQRLGSSSKFLNDNFGKFGSKLNTLLKRTKNLLTHRPPRMENYAKASRDFITPFEEKENIIPTILPQWDHTPRSGWNGSFLVNSTPELFKELVKRSFDSIKNKTPQKQIVFLKSWNEWGEGNYMEPDLTNGRGYIDALKSIVDEYRKK